MRRILHKIGSLRTRFQYATTGGRHPSDKETAIHRALQWLCAAQDAVKGGGISRAYSFRLGWELPYPETTGYVIPTFLALAGRHPELQLGERAWRAGRWLAEVQFESGAICSKQHRPGNTKPSVFNTGMVLHGWVSLLETRNDEQIRNAARKAVDWLIQEQETDGSWVKNAFNHRAHTYYTMVDWALIRCAHLAGDDRARAAAAEHLEWTLRQQRDNGWFDLCEFGAGEAVTTHTLSYTTQGLVESGRLLGENRYIETALRGTVRLRKCFEATGKLPGTFDAQWQPTANWECCTGNAQTSLVWQALGTVTGDKSWCRVADKLNRQMLGYQKVQCRTAGIEGAIPGSWPITGGYDPLNFPNHAAKFFADALTGPAGAGAGA
jgi:hypothetical protein